MARGQQHQKRTCFRNFVASALRANRATAPSDRGVSCAAMNTRRSVALELVAIGVAAGIFVATFRFRPPYVDFALATVAVALIVLSARRSTALWAAAIPAGDQALPVRAAWFASAAFTVVALAALAAIGAFLTESTSLDAAPPFAERLTNWHFLIAIALYFPWALIQQYIFQRYLLARLLQLVPLPFAIALTAAAFSCVHFPRWPVMAVVLIAGVAWSSIYARSRTLLPLACSHAVLGSAVHYWVFGRDLLEAWLPLWAVLA
jgi:membrane protease YdiL (CAAX protease family)